MVTCVEMNLFTPDRPTEAFAMRELMKEGLTIVEDSRCDSSCKAASGDPSVAGILRSFQLAKQFAGWKSCSP